MKPKPLDLDKIINSFEADIQSILYVMNKGLPNEETENKEQLMKLLKNLLNQYKQRTKSACEFYLMYKDKPSLFSKEYPELRKKLYECVPLAWLKSNEPDELYDWEDYNEWLFKLAFKSVFKGDKK